MLGAGVCSEAVDIEPLLRSAIDALSTLDDAALERLLVQAESVQGGLRGVHIFEVREVAALQQTFSELLSSTSRSLKTLERLRSNQEAAWVR